MKRISLPLSVIESALTLSKDELRDFLSDILAACMREDDPIPDTFPQIWPDMPSDISRQRRAALSHARCGVSGGRPRKGAQKKYDDGMDMMTRSIESPKSTDAAAYIISSNVSMTPSFWDEFREFTEDSGLPDDLITWAVDLAAAKSAGWPYIKAVLDRCIMNGITTRAEAEAETARHRAAAKAEKEKPSASSSGKIKSVTAAQFPQRQYDEKTLEDQCYGEFFRMAGINRTGGEQND